MADAQPRNASMGGDRMPKADFITSIILLVMSVGIVVLSVQMPRLQHRGINPYTVPGLVPGLLGVALTIMSLTLLLRSIRYGGFRIQVSRSRMGELARKPEVRRALLTAAFCLFYAIGLVSRLWYPASTFLFVFFFIVMFEYQTELPLNRQRRTLALAGIEALLTASVVSLVFRYLFLVRLP